jgi:hypothetical protein
MRSRDGHRAEDRNGDHAGQDDTEWSFHGLVLQSSGFGILTRRVNKFLFFTLVLHDFGVTVK